MIKVVLTAEQIPLDATVTKKTGAKLYTLRDRLRVFNEGHTEQELRATDGARFLVSENGDANVVSGGTELVWHAAEWALQDYLNELQDGTGQ